MNGSNVAVYTTSNAHLIDFIKWAEEHPEVRQALYDGKISILSAHAKLQKLLEMVAKSDNGVCALIAAEKENLYKQKGEYDTEFVKRVAKAYNTAILAWARKEGVL